MDYERSTRTEIKAVGQGLFTKYQLTINFCFFCCDNEHEVKLKSMHDTYAQANAARNEQLAGLMKAAGQSIPVEQHSKPVLELH